MHLEISFFFNIYQTSNYNQLLSIQYEVKLIAEEGSVRLEFLPVWWTSVVSPGVQYTFSPSAFFYTPPPSTPSPSPFPLPLLFFCFSQRENRSISSKCSALISVRKEACDPARLRNSLAQAASVLWAMPVIYK